MPILPVDHLGDHKVGPIVIILGKNIAKYMYMPCGRRLAEIGNSKPDMSSYGSAVVSEPDS
jgi:hypothetical protein